MLDDRKMPAGWIGGVKGRDEWPIYLGRYVPSHSNGKDLMRRQWFRSKRKDQFATDSMPATSLQSRKGLSLSTSTGYGCRFLILALELVNKKLINGAFSYLQKEFLVFPPE
jgi:hypothetical protein